MWSFKEKKKTLPLDSYIFCILTLIALKLKTITFVVLKESYAVWPL